jgi:hypothetical protein
MSTFKPVKLNQLQRLILSTDSKGVVSSASLLIESCDIYDGYVRIQMMEQRSLAPFVETDECAEILVPMDILMHYGIKAVANMSNNSLRGMTDMYEHCSRCSPTLTRLVNKYI